MIRALRCLAQMRCATASTFLAIRCGWWLWRVCPGPSRRCSMPRDVWQIGRAHVELQSLMRISYAVFCLKKKKITKTINETQVTLVTVNINDDKYIDLVDNTIKAERKSSRITRRKTK